MIPIVMVIIGRMFVRESDRFLHLREVREARAAGDDARVRKLLEEYHVDVAELGEATVTQLFGRPGYVRRQLLLLEHLGVLWRLLCGDQLLHHGLPNPGQRLYQ